MVFPATCVDGIWFMGALPAAGLDVAYMGEMGVVVAIAQLWQIVRVVVWVIVEVN